MELDFKKNLGNTDRYVRIIIGIILMVVIYSEILNGWLSIIAIIIAVSQFIEGIVGY